MSICSPWRPDDAVTCKARVLVIEDERRSRQFLRTILVGYGYRLTEVDTGAAGVKHSQTCAPDVIVLDLGLPDMDGIEVIRTIRKSSVVPILVTSARDRSIGAVAALNAGANDYLRKPFEIGQLQSRINSLIQNARRPCDLGNEDFITDHLRVDCKQRRVFVDDREIQLSPTEYGILLSLIVHAGGVVTLDQLCKEQATSRGALNELLVRTGMMQLRCKIEGDAMQSRYVQAEPGVGYRLVLD